MKLKNKTIKNKTGGPGLHSSDIGYGQVAGCHVHPGSIKCRKIVRLALEILVSQVGLCLLELRQ